MGYYPTREKAQIGAGIAKAAVEAFEKGQVLRIEPTYAKAYYFAMRLRDAFRSLKLYQDMIPEGCEEFIMEQLWSVSVLERENAVQIRPRGDKWVGRSFRMAEVGRASHMEPGTLVSCAGRPMREADNMVWLVARLMEGHREFTDFDAPKRDDVAEIVNKHASVAGVVLTVFEPPERVTFGDAQE